MSHKPAPYPVRLGLAAAVLALALGAALPARAQMATIEVGPTQLNSWLTQANTYMQRMQDYMEHGLQAQRWYQTYAHIQQTWVRMNGIIRNFGLPKGAPIQKVDADYLVAERCGGGLSVANLLRAVAPDSSRDLVGQQRTICVQLQMIENRKFNETIEFLQTTIPQMQKQVKAVEAMRATDNSNGTVYASTEAATKTLADIESEMQAWSAQMKSYDLYIAALTNTQKQLSRMALIGRKDAIGTVVKTTALKAALETGR